MNNKRKINNICDKTANGKSYLVLSIIYICYNFTDVLEDDFKIKKIKTFSTDIFNNKKNIGSLKGKTFGCGMKSLEF